MFFEIQTLCRLLGVSEERALALDDGYASMHLVANVEYANFERKFHKLKAKQKK